MNIITLFSYLRILTHFDPSIQSSQTPALQTTPSAKPNQTATKSTPGTPIGPPIIGFSATFSRHDGLALGKIFQKIVFHSDFLDMIKAQWCKYLAAFHHNAQIWIPNHLDDLTGFAMSVSQAFARA